MQIPYLLFCVHVRIKQRFQQGVPSRLLLRQKVSHISPSEDWAKLREGREERDDFADICLLYYYTILCHHPLFHPSFPSYAALSSHPPTHADITELGTVEQQRGTLTECLAWVVLVSSLFPSLGTEKRLEGEVGGGGQNRRGQTELEEGWGGEKRRK